MGQLIKRRWKISGEDLPQQFQPQNDCLWQALPAEAGLGQSNIFQLDQGLCCIETCYTPSRDLAIISKMDDQEPRLVVTVGLKGCSRFVGAHGDEIFFSEGNTTMTTFASSLGERHYEAKSPVSQIRLTISKAWFDKYFGEAMSTQVFNRRNIHVLCQRPTSAQAMVSAQQLLARDVPPVMKRMFLHTQALCLLSAELGQLFGEGRESPVKLTQKDKNIAEAAHDILSREFKTPPSVEELSKRVGTNQCKLKEVFHHYFNNTPYGILLDIRMRHAYQLLQSTRCPVSVAADSVGYSHASNFSAAFVKYFGISPKQISKSC